jgi:hypothetical protein
MRRPLIILAALAAVLVLPGTAGAAPPPDTAPCKAGGYANYVDPATGEPFKSQGRCVSFVNGGGTLAPVTAEPALTITLREGDGPPGFERYYVVVGEVAGADPSSWVTMTWSYGDGYDAAPNGYAWATSTRADVEGKASSGAQAFCNDPRPPTEFTVTARVDGELVAVAEEVPVPAACV